MFNVSKFVNELTAKSLKEGDATIIFCLCAFAITGPKL